MEKGTDIIKIAIVGPESTGKSTLSIQLAERLRTNWVPEFAREYLSNLDRPYEAQDLEHIAKGQLHLEQVNLLRANRFLIYDTTLLVIEIWSEHAYGHCPEWIKSINRSLQFDHVLLTDIDFPWQPDPLREHPKLRDYFFNLFKKKLNELKQPYSIVSGNEQARLEMALNLLNHASLPAIRTFD